MELEEDDVKTFKDFLSFLKNHPEIKQYKPAGEPMVSFTNFEIHLSKRKVFCHQQEVLLTKTEYDILLYLVHNANRVLTHRQIYEKIGCVPKSV